MAESKIRKLGWMAALTLVAAGGLAACGDQDATDTGTASAARVEAARGSDQHLYNQAAEIAATSAMNGSDQHLYNQAAEIARTQSQAESGTAGVATDDATPNAWEAGNRAAAAALGQG
jgi:hypothetical protein